MPKRPIVGRRWVWLAAVCLMTLGGCGQKGPLTLPATLSAAAAPTTPDAPR
ncbi:MAG: LPS translocon maturation chaperone LptM [Tepidimonas ignava]|uniref:LPS translocon maturation chaperone LptM n=1 Tax=Tepidimonas ignava TaxID=114249 RepID=UPI00391D7398